MPTRDRIRARREALGLSLSQLETRLKPYLPNMDKVKLSKIENGIRQVSADELPYFAVALECSVEDLVDLVEPEKQP